MVTFFCAINYVCFDVYFYISANKPKSFRFLVYYLFLFYGCCFVLEAFSKQKVERAFMPRKFIV
ncbi:hypothetical protein, partial [Staphylococcus xylosus]